jgi:hypothetical protein
MLEVEAVPQNCIPGIEVDYVLVIFWDLTPYNLVGVHSLRDLEYVDLYIRSPIRLHAGQRELHSSSAIPDARGIPKRQWV